MRNFDSIFFLLLPFSAFLLEFIKKHISTSVWIIQYPRAGQNIQQTCFFLLCCRLLTFRGCDTRHKPNSSTLRSSLVFTDGRLKNLFSFTRDNYKDMKLSLSYVMVSQKMYIRDEGSICLGRGNNLTCSLCAKLSSPNILSRSFNQFSHIAL